MRQIKKHSGLKLPVGALRGRFAEMIGSNIRIQSYPLFASSQHVGATAAVTILLLMLFELRIILGLPAFKHNYRLGLFSDCFVSDCFFRSFPYFSGLLCMGLFCTIFVQYKQICCFKVVILL